MDAYGCEVEVGSKTKLQNKKRNQSEKKLLCAWRKIAESIPQVDMKQSETESKKEKTTLN